MGRRAGAPGGGPASPPGVSRGIFSCLETERGRRDTVTESFAPMGLDLRTTWVPGLTPGAWSLDICATSSRGLPSSRSLAKLLPIRAAQRRNSLSPGPQPGGPLVLGNKAPEARYSNGIFRPDGAGSENDMGPRADARGLEFGHLRNVKPRIAVVTNAREIASDSSRAAAEQP